MSYDMWKEFSSLIQNKILSLNIPLTINTTESLEHTWHKIQTSIITSAFQIIPNKKFTVRNFYYTFSPKATDLHKDPQNLGSIMKQTKHAFSNHSSLSPNIYIQIQHINSKHNFNIPQPPLNSQNLYQWLQQTKIAWRTLYNARNLENLQHLRHHINSAINTRCEKILTQPTKMINSILNRHTDPIYFDNIKTEDNIITNPSCIKQHILLHFCQMDCTSTTQPNNL